MTHKVTRHTLKGFVPAIVTTVPIGPDVGVSVVMPGAGDVTVNARPLLA